MSIDSNVLQAMKAFAVVNRVPIISDEASLLLTEVVAAKQPLFILEIGTAIGYSSILLALNAPKAKIVTIEKDAERAGIARDFISQAELLDRITVIEGDAGAILASLPGRFDFVFIDAAKGQYLDYLLKVLDKLSPGTVIVADNVLFRDMVEAEIIPRRFRTIVKRLREYLEFVTDDSRFDTCVYSIGDGMAISYFKGDAND
jgi:predicted O-methyltransferase YrrM